MKKSKFLILTVGLCLVGPFAGLADVIIKQDFEPDTTPEGPEPKWMKHADTFVGIATEEDYDFAGGASKGSEAAIVITGGDDDPDSWKPAADFLLPDLKKGYLKISFKVKNPSTIEGDCLLQLWGKVEDGENEKLYQYLRVNPGYVRASGTGEYMFKDITSGESAEWHEIVWTVPLPGTDDSASLEIDGKSFGNFTQPPPADSEEIVRMRFFLQTNKTSDLQYAIDDLLVEHVKKK